MPTYIQILDGNTKVFANRDGPNLVSQTSFDQSTQQAISGGVQIDSWGLSAASSAQSNNQGGGKISISALEISRPYDQWSPTLFKYLTSGKILTQLTLVNTRATGDGKQSAQSVYTLANVVVTNQQWTSGGDGVASESLQFVPAKLSVAFQPQDASGKGGTVNQVGWDATTNRNF